MYVQGIMKQKLQESGINFDEFDGSKSVVLDPFEGLDSTFLQVLFRAFPIFGKYSMSIGSVI